MRACVRTCLCSKSVLPVQHVPAVCALKGLDAKYCAGLLVSPVAAGSRHDVNSLTGPTAPAASPPPICRSFTSSSSDGRRSRESRLPPVDKRRRSRGSACSEKVFQKIPAPLQTFRFAKCSRSSSITTQPCTQWCNCKLGVAAGQNQ